MSSPPTGLPPEVFARTRVKAVAAELAEQTDPKLQAALLFELGALTELRLGDGAAALKHYHDAVQRDASFRPPLFALGRHLQESRDDEALLKLYAKIAHASISARDRASCLVDAGCLLEDRLDDPAGALAAFERALVADPRCLSASVMRERALLAQNHRSEASVLLARRAAHTLEPKLRSALAIEAARELAADGDIDAAVEALLTALALPGRQLPTLSCLAELALRYGRPRVAARAHEDLGALLAGYAAGAGPDAVTGAESSADALDIAARYPRRGDAAQAAAFHYHMAALLRAPDPEHAVDALHAHERAAACMPADVLLGLELSAAYQSLDALSDAQAQLEKLLPTADARCTAVLQFELAELAERQGDSAAALAHLRAAHAAAPDAPAINAVLEDRLLDEADARGLCELLQARAAQLAEAQVDDRRVLLWRAALAADRANDTGRALGLWGELLGHVSGAQRTSVLRELHGTAARAGLLPQLAAAAQQLLESGIAAPERAAVWRSRYEAALGQSVLSEARTSLEGALEDAACQDWAPHAAWLFAGLQGDHALLALAHAKLAAAAEQHDDAPLAAAHLAARGRALLRAGEKVEATLSLRRALTHARADHYAAALLERCLLARGETDAAIALLRESAQAEADARAQQSALLSAGELAESAGQLELARRSYDEAAGRDPSDFAAQWARLRFAERSRDVPRRLSALRALAEREATHGRPGSAHLELGEALAARGEFAAAALPLTAAIENHSIALEAAAGAVLLPRSAPAEALRPRALSELAEQAARKTRSLFEHERGAELMHQHPDDARRLLVSGPPEDAREALLQLLLSEDTSAQRSEALLAARLLTSDAAQQAELALHVARCRAFRERQHESDADAVVAALALHEDAPGTLGAALALTEALDAADDPDTRVLALTSHLEQLGEPRPIELRAALARALLDAGATGQALALCAELTRDAPDDPSHWESLRVAARVAGDYEQVVSACDRLAQFAIGPSRAALLEEAAAVLHERLERREEAEARLRAVLAEAPQHKPAFERLHDVLVEREDLDGLLALLVERVAVSDSSDERVDLLYERARILRARGERDTALAAAEQLLVDAPLHAGALGLCAEIHSTGENWLGAVQALRRLAETELTPAQRRLSLEGCADFLEQKLGDDLGAYRELEKLLAHDLADYSVHVRMAKLAESAGLLQPAASALVRAAALSRGVKRAQLERKAAALYQQVDQPETARAALRRALVAHPSDELALRALYPQLIAPDERERVAARFLEALYLALGSEPQEPELQRCLVRTGALLERPVLVRMGLYALQALGHASDDELAAAETLRKARANRLLGAGTRWNEANFALLLPRELTSEVLELGQSLSAAWLEIAPDTPEKHGLRRRSRLGSREPHPLREALKTALAAFGLSLADSFGSEREQNALYPLRQPGTSQSWVIGREVQPRRVRPALLRALPLMAASRAGLLGLWEDEPTKVRARARLLLAAAGALSDGMLSGSAATLAPKLPRARRAALTAAFARLQEPETALQQLAHGTVMLGQRAALIACADLVEAASLLGSDPAHSLSTTHGGLALLRFWLSPACAELLAQSEVSP